MSTPFKKNLILWGTVLILLILITAGIAYYFLLRSKPSDSGTTEQVTPSGMQDFLQQRGEAGFRKKQALALVSVYRKMLDQYPDNLDFKKKLALAWFDAEEFEKALPLLEEISKTNPADAEVLEKIREAKRRVDVR